MPLALLDHVVNVPADQRMEVGVLLRDSVGCPMPGPSHDKVVLKWSRQSSDGCVSEDAISDELLAA